MDEGGPRRDLDQGVKSQPECFRGCHSFLSEGNPERDLVVTHRFPLEKYEEALETFVQRKDGAIKVVVEP